MISFDDFPVVYFGIGYLLAIGLVIGLFLRKKLPYFTAIFLLSGACLLLWMRVPVLLFNQEINADESQMIAHAMTLWQNPIYWQSVDGTTIGPLDNYLLLLTRFFGLPFDYTAARIVGLLCVLGSLFFFFRSLKNFFGENVAYIGLLPPLFLLTFAQEGDFVHYSSEQLPIFILNLSLFYLSKIWKTQTNQSLHSNEKRNNMNSPSIGRGKGEAFLYCTALLLGMSPFAKIQVAPLAAVIGLFALLWSYKKIGFRQALVWLLAGGLTFPLLIVMWATIYGVLDDLWHYYVLGNLIYAGGGSLWNAIVGIPSFFAKSPDFLIFISSLVIAVLGAIISNGGEKERRSWTTNIFFFAILWVIAALYAATKSGNSFLHYLNLCIYPLAFLATAFLAKFYNTQMQWSPIVAMLALLPFGMNFLYKVVLRKPLNVYVSNANHAVPLSEVAKIINQKSKPKDQLVVWGWMCKYHVETQLAQGTAENHSERCIYEHPMRQQYFDRYMADLERNKPRFFVDAVGHSLWVNDRLTQGHEAFLPLKEFIQKYYLQIGEAENTRIYMRK